MPLEESIISPAIAVCLARHYRPEASWSHANFLTSHKIPVSSWRETVEQRMRSWSAYFREKTYRQKLTFLSPSRQLQPLRLPFPWAKECKKVRATNGIVTVIICGLLNACTFHRMPLKSNLMAHGPKWALSLSEGLWKINQRLYSLYGEVFNHQAGHFLWSRREILERVEVSLDAVRENYRQQATERGTALWWANDWRVLRLWFA